MEQQSESSSPERAKVPAPYRPNALLRWIYRRFFSHLQVDDAWSGNVREAARRGTVVYVMRSISFLDFLCLDFLLKRLGLPLIRFVNDLGLGILEPFGRGERRLRLKRQIPEAKALRETLGSKASALLFLRKRPRIGKPKRKGEELEVDLIRTLIEAQRKREEPILLVPQTFVWTKLPPKRRRSIVDMFFGPVEWPGRVRRLFQFLFNYKNALLRSGEAFDLLAFMEGRQELTDEQMADKVRYALLRRIERERTLVFGPTKKTAGRIREELVRSPRVRQHIEAQAKSQNKSIAAVEGEAQKMLRRLQADQQPYMLAFLNIILSWVFRRIYDGLVVDREGIERVRDAARDGTIVYLPSHKSHVDYLVLSYVMYQHALSPPLIAAGDNLSFFPLGPILRRGGAFFIRRSFKGKKLYPALVDAYMRKLLLEGFPIEFFVEGGRSRTGKLLPPKFGLLSMVIDAALKLRHRKVYFVPISVGYERIIEERSYVHELGGGEKRKENVGGLLQTPKVLRSRYGRLYVQFGDILSFDELIAEHGGADRASLSPSQRRNLVQGIARRVTYQIDQVTVVTPAALVATALLVHRRRGISRGDLSARSQQLLEALQKRGARVAAPIIDDDGASLREDTFDEALALFLDAGLIREAETGGETVYRVPDPRRLALEYYKNNILHFFVPSVLIATALRRSRGDTLPVEKLQTRVRELSKLFKFEFSFRAEAEFDLAFEEALAQLEASGELHRSEDGITAASGEGGERLHTFAGMLDTYFEAYILAVRAAGSFLDGAEAKEKKEWLKRSLSLGQRMFLAGELELRESVSKPKLETAIKALHARGVLRSAGALRLAEDCGPEQLQALEERLGAYLPS